MPLKYQEIDLTAVPGTPATDWISLRMPVAFQPALVSVIVPTYNRAGFLREAISSVWNQTYRPIELLVIDDGSTDRSREVILQSFTDLPDDSGFSAYYIRQSNRGASAARNQGLLHSHGEFIQYLDSDDVLVRHKLAWHVAALRDDKTLDIVWSEWLVLPSQLVDQNLQKLNEIPANNKSKWRLTDQLIPWEPWPTLTRRRFVSAHPLWNERTSRWDDWEYALRLIAAHPKCAYSPNMCCIQRQHDQGRCFDYDFNAKGVEVGLNACREAAKACEQLAPHNRTIRQLIGTRYWEIGLEALLRGSDSQALEAFGSAASIATRTPFRIKAAGAWSAVKLIGKPKTKTLLSRYLAYKEPRNDQLVDPVHAQETSVGG